MMHGEQKKKKVTKRVKWIGKPARDGNGNIISGEFIICGEREKHKRDGTTSKK